MTEEPWWPLNWDDVNVHNDDFRTLKAETRAHPHVLGIVHDMEARTTTLHFTDDRPSKIVPGWVHELELRCLLLSLAA